jgi:cell wall-associated NlpC family hydrolase
VGIARTTFAGVCAVLVAALLAGALSAASPKERLREKRAEADAALAKVNALNQSFEASVEAWNGARYELDVTRHELVVDRRRLRSAERQRRDANALVAARLRSLYESGDDDTTLGIVLGSTSMSEILDRLDAARAVAAADRQLTERATAARNRFARAASAASAVLRRRTIAFQQRDRERRRIATLLDEHKRLLASVRSDVVKLQAEEAAQQARLRAEAQARLAAEARTRRAEAARAARAARAREAVTTTVPAVTPQPQPLPTTTVAVPTTTAAAPTGTAAAATTTASPPIATAPAGSGHPQAATIALRYLGVPYLWGGASPATGFDCSGLVMYVYAQLGISLPHYAAAQYQLGAPVGRDQLAPGDLVFFDALDHVGIYIGGGQFVHAPQTGDVVKITPLSDFGSSYVGARRL